MSESDLITMNESEFQQLITRLLSMPIAMHFLLFLWAGIQAIRGGGTSYLILLLADLISAVTLFAFAMLILLKAGVKAERSWVLWIISLGGYVPYFFGCYLVFYKGLWRLRTLLQGFSIMIILKAVVYLIIGYVIVDGIYKISALGNRIDDGDQIAVIRETT